MSGLIKLPKPPAGKSSKSDVLDRIQGVKSSELVKVSLKDLLNKKENTEDNICLSPVDVLFVHDATASIESVIDELVRGLNDVFRVVSKSVPLARFGLIGYRSDCDRGDDIVAFRFKSDRNKTFQDNLGHIGHVRSFGWEAPVCSGIYEASNFNWQSKYRIMVVLGDARARSNCEHDWKLYAEKIRKEIKVNSYVVYWKTEEMMHDKKWFKELADALGGKFFSSNEISADELAGFILAVVLKETGQLSDYMKRITNCSSRERPAISSRVAGLLNS